MVDLFYTSKSCQDQCNYFKTISHGFESVLAHATWKSLQSFFWIVFFWYTNSTVSLSFYSYLLTLQQGLVGYKKVLTHISKFYTQTNKIQVLFAVLSSCQIPHCSILFLLPPRPRWWRAIVFVFVKVIGGKVMKEV